MRKDERRSVWISKLRFIGALSLVSIIMVAPLACVSGAFAQQADVAAATRVYPKEMRGYKLARAKVEIKKQSDQKDQAATASKDTDALVQFGDARVARITPLGITLEVPITISAVKQGGHVDFLAFEDMVVNGMPVTVEDYLHEFDLPNNKPLDLPEPVRLYISGPRALLGALGEWNDSKETWPVTGRVYVFGRFKKFIFNFKRVVPVELTLSLPNPLKSKDKKDQPAGLKQ